VVSEGRKDNAEEVNPFNFSYYLFTIDF